MRRWTPLGLALLAVAIAYFVVPAKQTPGPRLRDFEAYYAAGATWHYHGDAYSREIWRSEKDVPGVVATRDEFLPFVGPPFGLPLWSALSRLSFDAAAIVWGTVLGLSFVTIALCSARLAGLRFERLSALGALTFGSCFGPLTSGIALGQVAILSCAAIVAIPFLLRSRATAAASGAFVAALQPNLAIVLVMRLANARSWIAFVCAALVAAGASALTLGGAGGLTHYLDVLRAHGAAERFIAIQTTPGAVARSFGATPGLAAAVGLGFALCVALALAVQYASRRYRPDALLALGCAALPLAIPFAHEHDFVIAFMPAVVVLARARGVAWLLAAFGALAISVDWLGLAQRPSGIASSAFMVCGAGLALTAFVPKLRPYHVLPVTMGVAVVLAGVFASQHRLPTWPDGLGFDYRVPATMPPATLWYDEQRRSGIDVLDPAWGVLRSFSLAGCGLLWAVATSVLAESRSAIIRSTRPVGTELDVGDHVDSDIGDR